MTDRPADIDRIRTIWRSLGHRLAVAGGCLVALLSLFHHVPASTASLRGAIAYLVVRLVAKWGLVALEHALGRSESTEAGEGETP